MSGLDGDNAPSNAGRMAAGRAAARKDVIGISGATPTTLAHGWHQALVNRRAHDFAGLFSEDALFTDVEHRTADMRAPRPIRGRAGGLIDEAHVHFDSLGLFLVGGLRQRRAWRFERRLAGTWAMRSASSTCAGKLGDTGTPRTARAAGTRAQPLTGEDRARAPFEARQTLYRNV